MTETNPEEYIKEWTEEKTVTHEQGTCTFCPNYSDYVFSVTDPGPPDEQVIGDIGMPICCNCVLLLKEADLNTPHGER